MDTRLRSQFDASMVKAISLQRQEIYITIYSHTYQYRWDLDQF